MDGDGFLQNCFPQISEGFTKAAFVFIVSVIQAGTKSKGQAKRYAVLCSEPLAGTKLR